MKIWRADADDLDAVARLMRRFRDHLGKGAPPDDEVRDSVERILADDRAQFLLAAAGEEPLGVCQLRFRWSVWTSAEDCWLEDLYVRDDARGNGVGRALTEAVLERARARGCRRVELDVNSENPAALALYRSLGFETGKTGGQDLLMRLRL
jgi:ribosomal protein S18 acetylase RimI-like enzyme